MNIGIIGLGFVGLTFSIAAADAGINVYGIEVNENIKACIKQGKAHFYEPELNDLIQKCIGKTFFLVDRFPTDIEFDAFIITVGTPLQTGTKTPRFDYIKQSLLSLEGVYTGAELIILRSTVSVGTTRNVVLPYLAALCNKATDDIFVSFCPERTVEGKAIEELTCLPQIISGNNHQAVLMAEKLFCKIILSVIRADSIEEAEIIKLFNNTYRDITFAIGNAFCLIAQSFGIDGIHAIQTANQGYQRSNICLPGFVGGPCLEKDVYILTDNMGSSTYKDYIIHARQLNESLEDMVVEWVAGRLGEGHASVGISGLAFKGMPETSDLRGSSSVHIAQKLKQKGYSLHLHDFVVCEDDIAVLELGQVHSYLHAVAKHSDILLVLNNHNAYKQIDEDAVFYRGVNNFCILDAWNCCNSLYGNEHIEIYNIGNIFLQRGDEL